MLYQNLFDLIPLVGSADKLISSDYHEDKHHKALSYCWKACSWQEKPTSVKSRSVSSFFLLSFWDHFFFCCIMPNCISSWNSIPVASSTCIWIDGWVWNCYLRSFLVLTFSPLVPQTSTSSGPRFSVNTKLLIKKRTSDFL